MTVAITWLSHAAFLIESSKGRVLIDPFLSNNPKASLKLQDLPPVDMILVTHGHGDHVGDTIALATRDNALVVASVEVVNWLRNHGVKRLHGQQAGGAFEHPAGRVKLTPAFHGSSLPDGSYGGQPVGMLLTVEGVTVYHAGDTSLFGDMALIGDEGVDLALLPIGDNFTMGPEDALKAADLIGPKMVIPMHYGTWPVIDVDQERFRGPAAGKPWRVSIPTPGEKIRLN